MSACIPKKYEYTSPNVKVDTKSEDVLKSLKAGGQPGEIALNGVVLNSDGTLDKRISIEQSVGTSSEKTELSACSLPKFNPDLKRKEDYKPSKFDTYLNVGCDLKDDLRIEGMNESKNKPNEAGIIDTFGAVASMVDKIFICGKVEVNESVAILNANEIYLENAEISMSMPMGMFSVTSDILFIDGENLISTKGASDSAAFLLSAPSIKLISFFNIVPSQSDLEIIL